MKTLSSFCKTVFEKNWLLIPILLLISAIYFSQLDHQSIWRDEALSIVRSQLSLSDTLANINIVQDVRSPDLHPPFYFLLLHGWRSLAGSSEFALRFPSALAILISLCLLATVGRQIWGRETGMWAAALAAISPFYFWYSQEARMYALLVLESLFFLRILWPLLDADKNIRWSKLLVLGGVSAITMYTHYTGIFLFCFSIFAILSVRLNKRNLLRVIAILIIISIVAIPLYQNIYQLLSSSGFVAFSQRPLMDLFQEIVKTFSLGSAGPLYNAGWRQFPFLILFLIGFFALFVSPRSTRKRALLIGSGFFVMLGLFYLSSWLQANYSNPRHLIILSPIWFLMMGHGLALLKRLFWPLAVGFGVATSIIGCTVLFQTITDPPISRDDVRGLAQLIETQSLPGDTVLWHDAIMMTTFNYYGSDLPYTALPKYAQFNPDSALKSLDEWEQNSERVWFVRQPSPFFFDKTIIPKQFETNWVHIQTTAFKASWSNLRIDLYAKPQSLTALPSGANLIEIQEGPTIITGIAPKSDAVAGKGLWFSVFWLTQDPTQTPSVCIRLLDSTQTEWSSNCAILKKPASINHLLEQQIWLSLPIGLAPTTYDVQVVLGNQIQQAGTLPVQAALLTNQLSPKATFSNGIELVNIEWIANEFNAGMWAIGDILWRITSPKGQDLEATVRLCDWKGKKIVEQDISIAPPDYPLNTWKNGELIRTKFALKLPFHQVGKFQVLVSIKESSGKTIQLTRLLSNQWARAGKVRIVDWPLITVIPDDLEHKLDDVQVGNLARLVGYNLEKEGHNLVIELVWQCLEKTNLDYGVFIHIGQQGTPPLAQASGTPAQWTRPTSSWRPGEIIADSHSITLPADVDYEDMSILVGMYDQSAPSIRLPISKHGLLLPGEALNLGKLP